MNNDQKIKTILRQPYCRVILPEPTSGTYSCFIPDFPGCVSQGDTWLDATANLEEAAKAWLAAVLDMGQQVPEPQWYRKLPGLADTDPEEF